MDFAGRTLVGKYRIEKLLGQGGMGSVWRGTHAVTGRKIAVKILDEKFLTNTNVVRRFGREARAASSIAHEGIVEVLDLDQSDEGIPFLVMEFLEGESLAHRIDYGERMTEAQVVALGAQLLDALHAAHESGVVHRDLKPDNIYVIPATRGQAGVGERVKILDFGISSKDDEQDAKLTVTGSVLGTPHYMSPEQAMGDTETDRRVDIYAAGVVLYECLVGAVPFEGANYNKLLRIILDNAPTPPSKRGARVSAAVEAVILKALSKRKEERPGTAAEMRQLLLRASRGEDFGARSARSGLTELSDPGLGHGLEGGFGGGLSELSEPGQGLRGTGGRGSDLEGSDLRDGTGRTEDSVAMRWLGADLEQEPVKSRPEVAVPRAEPAPRPSAVSTPNLGAVKAAAPPSHAASMDGFGGFSEGGSASLEFDELALPRRAAPSRTATRSSSGMMPAVGAVASEPSRTSQPPPSSQQFEARGAGVRAAAAPEETSAGSPVLRWLLVIVAGLCAVGLAAFALRNVLNPPQPPPIVTTTPPPVPTTTDVRGPATTKQVSGPTFVQLDVVVQPSDADARMRLDGIPGATSPIRVRRDTRHVLEVSAPGFVDTRVEIFAERDRRIVVALDRAP